MDKQVGKREVVELSRTLMPRPKGKFNSFSLFGLQKHFRRLSPALQISFQYTSIVLLCLLLAKWFAAIFPDFTILSALSSDGNFVFVGISALVIHLVVRRRSLIDQQADPATLEPQQQNQQRFEEHFEARSNELSHMLDVSQGRNAKLEGLLADQTATAIESDRLHEEAGQTAILEERQRLGRDLHDSVTQALYSMVLFADATSLALAAGKQTEASENLYQVRKMARQAMADMRLLIYQLHPPQLKKEGLAAALQTRLEAVESRAGLQTEFRAKGECNLPAAVEQELYQIAQEALNNVIKHAKAEHVSINLDCTGELNSNGALFCMTISDDGIGFDVATAQASGGVGLRGINERAQQIHATLTLESSPNHGTTVRVEV